MVFLNTFTVLCNIFPTRRHDVFLQLRFCMKDYEPFDTSDINKYVITDDYTPLWEVYTFEIRSIGFEHFVV